MGDKRLKDFLEKGGEVNLGNLFEYLQGIAEGLGDVIRWKKREDIAGQSVQENDLQHIFKTTFLTIMCAIMENEWRKKYGLLPYGKRQLNVGLLATMALVHDIGEIIEGDMPHFEKIQKSGAPQEDELEAFRKIVEPLPQEVKENFVQAFKRTMFKSDLCIKDVEAKFFNAVENLSGLKRGLHECRLGNLHFAPKCLEWHIKTLQDYALCDFPSLRIWFAPYIRETERYLEEFKKQREKYLAEFVERGGKKEDFPF